MIVRLTQIDGGILPNIALMRLARFHREMGDEIHFTKKIERDLFEPEYDRVYGSSIFDYSAGRVQRFRQSFPDAIVGGTGGDRSIRVEDFADYDLTQDYSIYDDEHFDTHDTPEGVNGYPYSVSFSQRGCRLRCKFCVVPQMEGGQSENLPISAIWRGDPYPKKIVLLDNDFWGQPDWRSKATDIIEGGFKINFNQGINCRLINEEQAEILGEIMRSPGIYDRKFRRKMIHTAFDNPRDEKVFRRGIDMITRVGGVEPQKIMVMMLVGYWKGETIDDVYDRWRKINDLGCNAYVMVYSRTQELIDFRRWVNRRLSEVVEWENFDRSRPGKPKLEEVGQFYLDQELDAERLL